MTAIKPVKVSVKLYVMGNEVPVDYLLGRDEYVEGFIDKLQSES